MEIKQETRIVAAKNKIFRLSDHFIQRYAERVAPQHSQKFDFEITLIKSLRNAVVLSSEESQRGVLAIINNKFEVCDYYLDLDGDTVYVVVQNRDLKYKADYYIKSCYKISKSDWARKMKQRINSVKLQEENKVTCNAGV